MEIDPRLQPLSRPPPPPPQQQHHHPQQHPQHYQHTGHQQPSAPNTPHSQPFALPPPHTHPQSQHSTPQQSPLHAGAPSAIDPALSSSGSYPPHYASTSAPPPLPSTSVTSVPGQIPPHQQTASPSTGKPAGNLPPDLKRPRACESCRTLKVRCQPHDPSQPAGACRRCTKAGRECIFTVPTRKRQKKTDTKVAELEKKIDALTASLNATRQQARAAEGDDDDDDDGEGQTPLSSGTRGELSPGRPFKRRRSDEEYLCDVTTGSSNCPRADHAATQRYPEVQKHMRQFLSSTNTRVSVPPYITSDDRFLPTVEYVDVIDQELLSIEMAVKLFHHYNQNMAPTFPVVIFPSNMQAEDLRRQQPTLFVAVLAVASGTSHPDLHKALQKETTRAFAERIMINGEKSMELVKALLILSIWYYPPERYEELKFYNLIHQAAIMALDLGLGKSLSHLVDSRMHGSAGNLASGDLRHSISEAFNSLSTQDKGSPDSLKSGRKGPRPGSEDAKPVGIVDESRAPTKTGPPPKNPFPEPTTVESRRTWLACYWSCSHVAISMRRPNLLRYTKFMDDSLDILATAPEAAESDKVLCQWIRLQRISEELAETFAFDDPGAKISIEDPSMQHAMKGFVRRLEGWKSKVKPALVPKSLALNYHLINLFAHEIALHIDHNTEDFRPPFTERIIREPSIKPGTILTSFHIDAISACMKSAQAILDSFSTFSTFDLHCIPVFSFVRVAYASMILIKIYFTTKLPDSELGRVIDSESLRVEEHLSSTLSVLAQAAKGDRNRPAGKFTMILIMLRTWYFRRKSELEKAATPEEDSMDGMNHNTPSNGGAIPATPEAFNPSGNNARNNPPTPLQLLSNAAAGLVSPNQGNKQFFHHQQLQQQQQFASHQQYPTSQDQSSIYESPQNQWGQPGAEHGMPGMVEFQAGDLSLGLGGQGADMFIDDSFWGMMDQNGLGMTAWMGPLGEWGFG